MDRVERAIQTFVLLLTDAAARDAGVPVEEVAELLEVSPEEVPAWIDEVGYVGDPLGSPDTYVDLAVEGDRVRVYASSPGVSGALRFSMAETLALLFVFSAVDTFDLGGRRPSFAERLSALRERLLGLVAEGARPEAEPVLASPGPGVDGEILALVEAAARERRALFVRYFSERQDRLIEVEIEPALFGAHRGIWYAVAFGDGGRIFRYRVDRIREARLTDRRFEVPETADPGIFDGEIMFSGATPHEVTLRFHDGTRRVVKTASPRAIQRWVREEAGAVEIEAPAEVREALHAELLALRDRYED
ncbi:MAG: WYL domain-containing transcriptional regulator [Deltaproteobacteria bacterium]|nr:MAG: WYL domain-containing transcriptional regulator [Deltaproteobacteria bacterium]